MPSRRGIIKKKTKKKGTVSYERVLYRMNGIAEGKTKKCRAIGNAVQCRGELVWHSTATVIGGNPIYGTTAGDADR